MSGVALDPHHAAQAVVKQNLNRDAVVGDNQAVGGVITHGWYSVFLYKKYPQSVAGLTAEHKSSIQTRNNLAQQGK
jgi:hypothetical protein